MVLWGIWFNINAYLYNGMVRFAEVLLGWVSGGAHLAAAAVWTCPLPGILNLNSDVAVKPDKNSISIGVVIRDSFGLVVAAVSKTLVGSFYAESGEFLALRDGLLLDGNLGMSVHLIEVDACNVVSSVLGSDSSGGENGLVINDIKELFQDVGFLKCQTVSRKSSGVAHNLAFLTLSSLEERYWHNVCLSCIFPCL
ncbi:hypothetical protein ACOSQ2_014579 [Xanthoceras sorbifolium]